MLKSLLYFACLLVLFAACKSRPAPQQPATGLQKIYYQSEADLAQLRAAGAEIVVQQPDYVVVRLDSAARTLAMPLQPITEQDLVQRLIRVLLVDSTSLQRVVNTGVDLWEVRGDTLIARAYDLYIEKLRAAGFSVEIIAEDASTYGGKQK